jgi:hypothetical protein
MLGVVWVLYWRKIRKEMIVKSVGNLKIYN